MCYFDNTWAGKENEGSSDTDNLGVFNSYHAGAVAYGDAEGDLQAGYLVGLVQGRGDTAACFGSLYYQEIGVLPTVGTYDASDAAKAMKLSNMKLGGFVKTLNDYKNISLRGATWSADADEQSPVCGEQPGIVGFLIHGISRLVVRSAKPT